LIPEEERVISLLANLELLDSAIHEVEHSLLSRVRVERDRGPLACTVRLRIQRIYCLRCNALQPITRRRSARLFQRCL